MFHIENTIPLSCVPNVLEISIPIEIRGDFTIEAKVTFRGNQEAGCNEQAKTLRRKCLTTAFDKMSKKRKRPGLLVCVLLVLNSSST